MRERLIELIADARNDYYDFSDKMHEKGMPVGESSEEYIADYLLKNGVIVPPCAVNQMCKRLLKLSDEAINDESTSYSNIVDYLLENGVIMPPCKVGDVVYRILYGRIYKFKIAEISTFMRGEQYFFEFLCCVGLSFSSYDVGKTVFLTSEEAEQALKEGARE